MTAFSAPVDDILFSLIHVARAKSFDSWDDDVAADILEHFAQFAEGVLAPLNSVGDAEGVKLVEGRVKMPTGFVEAFGQLAEGGWQGLTAPEKFGGMAQSSLVAAAVSEVFVGANHAMQMVCNLVPGAIETLMHFGTEAQQGAWVPRLVSGEYLSTMCLTEAGAGSDLAAIRCRAEERDGVWRINGEKIFISGGDQDMSSGIVHLVLARTGAMEDGVKGLSLFLCEADHGVSVTRVEEKLGLHASPTCQLAFDDAEAELIGTQGQGLMAMFTVMNHARIDVSLQGVAHAARASQIALAYADERTQGRRADGTPARLTDHADVRRMLDRQDALALGARAMCHVALAEMERGVRPELCEFLTSLCKIFATEAGIEAADLGIQVLGGYGYLDEYLIGQVWRDARITSIYEGTNGIHARTLATRGLRGAAPEQFVELIAELADGGEGFERTLVDWRADVDRLRNSEDAAASAYHFAQTTAELLYRAVWKRIDAVSQHHRNPVRLQRLAEAVSNS